MMIALAANLLTSILCAAVLVQSVRMARMLNKVKEGDLPRMVTALDNATDEARAVLSEMKRTLGADYAQHARQVERARELYDELGIIVGIGDAAAERILAAMQLANGQEPPAVDEAPDESPDETGDEAAAETGGEVVAINSAAATPEEDAVPEAKAA